MSDFVQTEVSKIHYKEIANRVKNFKESEKGESRMNKLLEDLLNEAREEGIEEGIEKGREEGIEEGREEGIEKGREEGRQQLIAAMRRAGMDTSKVETLEVG